jgi:hypothetical protein
MIIDDKTEKILSEKFDNFMDAVFYLAGEIGGKCTKTHNEINFLEKLDEYCDAWDEADMCETVKERMENPEFISMKEVVKGTELEKYFKEEK